MASSSSDVLLTVDTGDITDAQTDFLGTKLATCSLDGTVKIFEVNVTDGTSKLVDKLEGHEGPVRQVAWADPRFGAIVASCSEDTKMIIWKESSDNKPDGRKWEKLFLYNGNQASVNTISWAPPEWGLILAAGSSDGRITLLSWETDRWFEQKIINAHGECVNSICWAPAPLKSLVHTPSVKRFASGGGDNLVKIWREQHEHWVEEEKLEAHNSAIVSVAWSPAVDIGMTMIASSAENGRVLVWHKRENTSEWVAETLHVFEEVVHKITWNFVGEVLCVSVGKREDILWKRNEAGSWICISDPNFERAA